MTFKQRADFLKQKVQYFYYIWTFLSN
jgi:hypothetical protein